MTRLLPLLLVAALSGCDDSTSTVTFRCDITLDALSPASGDPGDAVVVTGTPFTTSWDSSVYVGDTRALLQSVDRDDCDACDDCREDNDCNDCNDCDACDLLCEQTCEETSTFVIPDLAGGTYDVRLYNSHGLSNPLPLTVASPADTGGSETGGTETGGTETGSTETGSTESAPADTSGDTSAADSGSSG